MQTIPTPTTRTRTYESGETAQFTDWTIGAYTLRKTEETNYTNWGVVVADRDLPTITEHGTYGAKAPEFGVNWSACGTRPTADARAYGAQIAAAAYVADVFNEIVAAN